MKNYVSAQAYKQKVTPLSLYTYADSLETIDVTKSPATLLYFWRQREEQHDSCVANIKRLHKLYQAPARLLVADINMDVDTIKWRRQARRDSIKDWSRYWAIGGEMNVALQRLEVGRTPYMIVVDSTGTQRYRGDNFSKAQKTVEEILKK